MKEGRYFDIKSFLCNLYTQMSQVETSEKTLFVRGLDYSTTDAQLEEAFSDCGPIKTCFTVKDKGQYNIVMVIVLTCVRCRG